MYISAKKLKSDFEILGKNVSDLVLDGKVN